MEGLNILPVEIFGQVFTGIEGEADHVSVKGVLDINFKNNGASTVLVNGNITIPPNESISFPMNTQESIVYYRTQTIPIEFTGVGANNLLVTGQKRIGEVSIAGRIC